MLQLDILHNQDLLEDRERPKLKLNCKVDVVRPHADHLHGQWVELGKHQFCGANFNQQNCHQTCILDIHLADKAQTDDDGSQTNYQEKVVFSLNDAFEVEKEVHKMVGPCKAYCEKFETRQVLLKFNLVFLVNGLL